MARRFEQIIEDQIKLWERSSVGRARRERPHPVITISRAFGTRGAALAEMLGRRTGFTVWDQELVQAIAEEAGGDERLMRSLDERHRKAIDDAVRGALMGSPHTNTQYLRALMRVVQTIAHHGNAIIVGRGANYILAPRDRLAVRLVCPLDECVRRYAERENLDEETARRKIVEMDAVRAEFVRHNFKRDVTDPADYDLVLNAATFDLDAITNLVLEAYTLKTGVELPVAA
ncbi:cytidylate kinase-like family protein [Rhodocaloribacter sp.]